MKKLKWISAVVVLGLSSCGEAIKNENKPNMHLAYEYGIDSTQLVYQYYQRFGFTDICEDIRMVSKMNDLPGYLKKLPISIEDLKLINEFSNKVDTIRNNRISVKSNTRDKYYDIELDFMEYISDNEIVIQLNKGEYEISQTKSISTFKVYDSESGLFYIESHRCDGN